MIVIFECNAIGAPSPESSNGYKSGLSEALMRGVGLAGEVMAFGMGSGEIKNLVEIPFEAKFRGFNHGRSR